MTEDPVKDMVDEGRDREEIVDYMRSHNERVIDLDNLPDQGHIWIDRGAVMSCEGAPHPNHHVFKRR